jgi:hypothetical protein
LLGAVALLGAAAPGAPTKEVSAEKWVRSICTALGDWEDALADARANQDPEATKPDELKETVVAYLDEVTEATNTLLSDLKKAGTPDVDNGKAVARVFRKGFRQARDTFADAANAAEDLDTDDQAQFDEEVAEIVTAIEEGATEIGATFDEADSEYDVPELDEAFEAEPACARG